FENPFERYWMSPSGDPASVEVAVLQPEGKVVGYPWKTTLFDRETETVETFTAFTASSTEMPLLLNPRYAPVSSQWARYDGNGLNPLLRHPGMIIHPPMLYLGFTGFVIPFA